MALEKASILEYSLVLNLSWQKSDRLCSWTLVPAHKQSTERLEKAWEIQSFRSMWVVDPKHK